MNVSVIPTRQDVLCHLSRPDNWKNRYEIWHAICREYDEIPFSLHPNIAFVDYHLQKLVDSGIVRRRWQPAFPERQEDNDDGDWQYQRIVAASQA